MKLKSLVFLSLMTAMVIPKAVRASTLTDACISIGGGTLAGVLTGLAGGYCLWRQELERWKRRKACFEEFEQYKKDKEYKAHFSQAAPPLRNFLGVGAVYGGLSGGALGWAYWDMKKRSDQSKIQFNTSAPHILTTYNSRPKAMYTPPMNAKKIDPLVARELGLNIDIDQDYLHATKKDVYATPLSVLQLSEDERNSKIITQKFLDLTTKYHPTRAIIHPERRKIENQLLCARKYDKESLLYRDDSTEPKLPLDVLKLIFDWLKAAYRNEEKQRRQIYPEVYKAVEGAYDECKRLFYF